MTQNNTDSNEQQGESHHLLIVRDHYHVDTLGHIAERRCSCSLSAPLHRYVCAVCVDTRSRAPLAAVEGDVRRLTLPELNHLSALLEAERESGEYAGPREQYYARTERLIRWCREQIGDEKNATI